MVMQFLKSTRSLLALLGLVAGSLSLGLTSSHAQSPALSGDSSAIYAAAQQWLNNSVAQQGSDLPLRMEVEVGRLDPRLTLSACQQVEPYLPPGVRLWGKARLGLRCVSGEKKWNVFLPITVRAFGPAWVVKSQVLAGSTLGPADAMAVEVDWAEQRSPIVANQVDWVGKTATRLLAAGQPLRQEMVKAALAFQSGAQVRVVASGSGFSITAHAYALSAGVVGEVARVRMDNGQVISGTVASDRSVRVVL